MKPLHLFAASFLAICSLCLYANNYAPQVSASFGIQEEPYTLDFKEYGFVLKAPCKMEDVSIKPNDDFLINYGGITEKDNPSKMAAYQLIVTRLPIGYRNLTKTELADKVNVLIRSRMSSMKNIMPVSFGYEGYKGYVGESIHNGMRQKGVFFSMNNYVIALTVISNNNLEEKFNKFTNGFKTVPTHQKIIGQTDNSSNSSQKLSFGYSIAAPCKLKQYQNQDVDYSYSGAVNPNNQDIAIIYKIQVSKLPIAFNNMISSDRIQIKNNLIAYLKSKGSYTECAVNVKKHFAYKTNYNEGGFNAKECLILTDNYIIELIMLSKQKISEKQFTEFISSLRKY